MPTALNKREAGSLLADMKSKGRLNPIEFLLKVMWNRTAGIALRVDCASRVAPYIHRKQPLELQHSGEIEYIPPFVPSRHEMSTMDDKPNINEDDPYDIESL